jgi:hypothetical protein
MCLTVVAVAAMSVVGRGSMMATVEEAARETTTAAAEEADDGPEIAPQNSKTWIYESTGKQALPECQVKMAERVMDRWRG